MFFHFSDKKHTNFSGWIVGWRSYKLIVKTLGLIPLLSPNVMLSLRLSTAGTDRQSLCSMSSHKTLSNSILENLLHYILIFSYITICFPWASWSSKSWLCHLWSYKDGPINGQLCTPLSSFTEQRYYSLYVITFLWIIRWLQGFLFSKCSNSYYYPRAYKY